MPCESSIIVITPSRKRAVVLRADGQDLLHGRGVAAHAEDPVEDDDHAADAVGHGLELAGEVGRIVVREDRAPVAGDVGDPHRADDAVVVERVADPIGVGHSRA
jgi:hypothetical protein